jgi:serine phosphatase RsbU (regulator of sigma subunit)
MASRIVVSASDGRTETVALERESVTIGRSSGHTLSVPDDPRLSRRHLAFEPNGSGWTARDLGSSNGAFVNQQPISEARQLRSGDVITAAGLRIVYERDPEAEPERADATGQVVFETSGAEHFEMTTQFARLDDIMESGAKAIVGKDVRARRWTSPAMALLRAGRELGSPRPLEELFDVILDLAMEAAGAARGVLLTLDDDDELKPRARRGSDFRISKRVRDQVIRDRMSLIIQDALVDPRWKEQHSIISQGIRSLMAAPLQTDDRVIGMLYLDSGETSEFTTEDLELVTVMANIAAVRIEHDRLAMVERRREMLEKELAQAADIQMGCIPERAPRVPGYELAGATAPCRTVGGDYFDYVPRSDGKLVFLIADVAGKGMPAALLVMNLQARIQALAETADDLGRTVARLNHMIKDVCPSNRFITCFLAVLDPATGRMQWANAGHEPCLVLRRRGAIERLGAGGPPLGVFRDFVYATEETTVEPGDRLLLVTDGVTEAQNPMQGDFGGERVEGFLIEYFNRDADDMVRELKRAVDRWTGDSSPHDDVTVVALRRDDIPKAT